MTALIQERDTKRRDGVQYQGPVAAAKKIYQGGIVCIDTAGNLTPGATAANLTAVGMALATVDNLTGQAGDKRADYRKGVFGPFANSTSTDQITRADINKDCYLVDDQTVAKTSGSGTRSIAGKVDDIDANGGVWVKFA